MDKILDMIGHWDKIGQFLFFFIVLVGILALCHQVVYFLVVLIRGWPKDHPKL